MTDPRDAGHPDELSPGERRAFDALAHELTPPDTLEDRIIALLRQRGHLPIPLEAMRLRRGRGTRGGWWIAVAAAATIAVFFSGMAVGQFVGMRNAMSVVTASAATASEAADNVRRAGDLYVAALTSLGQLRDTTDVRGREQARQAALTALGNAAEQMAHLAPDDPLAAAVMRGLNQRNRASGSEAPSFRSVIWY